MIAGFGDDASMFAALSQTPLVEAYDLLPLDLPGFGARRSPKATDLATLAELLDAKARETGAEIVLAHSVASIIASLAALEPASPITTILSLEGNLTAEDAYFSGTAADFEDPETFRTAFLQRLAEMAATDTMIARYRRIVSRADPVALWELGRDARRFSTEHVPGEVLTSAARVVYLYNPDNCPASSLAWLDESPLERVVLPGASHWASIDRPELLADAILAALS